MGFSKKDLNFIKIAKRGKFYLANVNEKVDSIGQIVRRYIGVKIESPQTY